MDGDTDDHVDRPVGDLPVADLHHQRVDEDHRVDGVQRSSAPLGHLFQHQVGDPRDGVLADRGAVDVSEVRADLPGRQPSRGQRQHDLVDAVQPTLPLVHDLRLQAPVAVPRDVNPHRPELGEHRLRALAIAGVLPVAAGPVVLVIADVLGNLHLERGVVTLLVRPVSSPPDPISSTPSAHACSTSCSASSCSST